MGHIMVLIKPLDAMRPRNTGNLNITIFVVTARLASWGFCQEFPHSRKWCRKCLKNSHTCLHTGCHKTTQSYFSMLSEKQVSQHHVINRYKANEFMTAVHKTVGNQKQYQSSETKSVIGLNQILGTIQLCYISYRDFLLNSALQALQTGMSCWCQKLL